GNENREIWLNPAIDSIGKISIRFKFRPKLVQWLVGWILDLILRGLYKILLRLLTVGSAVLRIKLVTLPETLPVSGISIRPLKVVVGNWESRLFSGVKIGL